MQFNFSKTDAGIQTCTFFEQNTVYIFKFLNPLRLSYDQLHYVVDNWHNGK